MSFEVWAVEVGNRKSWFRTEREARELARDMREDYHNPLPWVRRYVVDGARDMVILLNGGDTR